MEITNKNVCVVGLGKSGLSCIEFLQKHHANIFAMDMSTTKNITLPDTISLHLGSLREDWLFASDLIVLSPGIALSTPAIAKAVQAGKKVIGDIALFCQFAKKPIIAITGSNGKSTVTTLVTEMAKSAGINVGMGGNIGIPALSLLDKDHELFVLELSSFQLETTDNLNAFVATILNISEDHLNRYEDLDAYRQAKLNIYRHCQYAIINQDDPNTDFHVPIFGTNFPQKIFFGEKGADYWIAIENGQRYLMAKGVKVLACDELGIQGKHNEMNALVSVALAQALDIPLSAIQHALRHFTGLDHRFQLVHKACGIRWINDSKATNVGSTIAGLAGLQIAGNLHLLLGGDGKDADFSPLAPYVNAPTIFCYCFGQDGKKLAKLSPQSRYFSTMQDAIQYVKSQVKSGDTVLLSPACASLDQFRSFEERGEIFTALAKGNG